MERAVAWLLAKQVLLPGISTLERFCAHAHRPRCPPRRIAALIRLTRTIRVGTRPKRFHGADATIGQSADDEIRTHQAVCAQAAPTRRARRRTRGEHVARPHGSVSRRWRAHRDPRFRKRLASFPARAGRPQRHRDSRVPERGRRTSCTVSSAATCRIRDTVAIHAWRQTMPGHQPWRTPILTVLLHVGLATFMPAATADTQPLVPRLAPAKPAHTRLSPMHDPSVVVVKFAEGTDVHVKAGPSPSLAAPPPPPRNPARRPAIPLARNATLRAPVHPPGGVARRRARRSAAPERPRTGRPEPVLQDTPAGWEPMRPDSATT